MKFRVNDGELFPTSANQKPRCKQRGIKLAALQSSGVFDPRGIRQISMQTWLFSSLLAGINILMYNRRKLGNPIEVQGL